MKEKMQIKDAVLFVLRQNEEARGNDNLCVAETFKLMGLPTDLNEIAKGGAEFRIGTVTRWRRLWQSRDPGLKPIEQVTAKRKAREKRFEGSPEEWPN